MMAAIMTTVILLKGVPPPVPVLLSPCPPVILYSPPVLLCLCPFVPSPASSNLLLSFYPLPLSPCPPVLSSCPSVLLSPCPPVTLNVYFFSSWAGYIKDIQQTLLSNATYNKYICLKKEKQQYITVDTEEMFIETSYSC